MPKKSVMPLKALPALPALVGRFVIGSLIFLSAFMVLMYEIKGLSDEEERPTTEETCSCGGDS